jgi:hypothetical protein
MANTYTLIASNILGSSAASVTFSAIPATYTDLVVRCSTRIDTASGNTNFTLAISLNGNTATDHSYRVLRGTGTTVNSFAASSKNINGVSSADGATADTFGSAEFYLPNYAGSTTKPSSFFSVAENNVSGVGIRATAGFYNNSAAVSSIVIWSQPGINLDSGSSFYLYGISNS